jgi:uncharacterized protein
VNAGLRLIERRRGYLPAKFCRDFAAVVALALSALLSNAFADEPMLLDVDPAKLRVIGNGPDAVFSVEVADEASERASGLMFRSDMPDDRAMLFVFDAPRRVAMWMKNTPMALDMVFADASGTITYIAENTVPQSLETISVPGDVLYVLEVKAGLTDALGIETGEKLVHPLID